MNYNSVEEIFAAGIDNMEVIRNNSKITSGNDVVTGVDWFNFNGTVASNIYVSAYSWIGFGSTSENLKVNRRSGSMYYLYREEGTLLNHYRFLKIRRVGYSYAYSTSSSYALTYDVILWDTGDISLHMVSIPTSYNIGTYSLVASSTYTYTVSASAPDVTFIKTDSGFDISNEIIDLIQRRYLIRSGSTYYTVANDALSEIGSIEISSDAFLTHGTKETPAFSLLVGLVNPEILYWTDYGPELTEGVIINGVPPLPQIVYYPIQSIPDSSMISNMEVKASKDVLLTITFDEGATWKYYQDNAWVTAASTSEGMTAHILKNIQPDAWAEVSISSAYQVRCVLPAITSTAGSLAVGYTE